MTTKGHIPLHRHPKPHHEWMRRARHAARQEKFSSSIVISVLFATFAFFVNLVAINYATEHVSNSVTDIVLSNIPVFDVDGFFVYGTFLLLAFMTLICLAHPKRIPFTLNSVALLWIIRSAFASLTHIAPFVTNAGSDFSPTMAKAFFGGDLFFSAHTGVPFLFALIYWHENGLRYALLGWSAYFGIVVLLGHLHYSIDVAAAFFITYAIYCIARRLFPRSYALFHSDAQIKSL